MSLTASPGSSMPGLPTVAVLFLVWAFLFYLARLWSKFGKTDSWGQDGTVISMAMLASIAHVISIYYAWHRGYRDGWEERSRSEDLSAAKKSLYAAQLLFVASVGLTRTSTALFTARILTLGEQHRRLANTMITLCATSTPALILVVAIRSPLLQPWDALEGSQEMFVRWIIVEVVGLVNDASIVAFSIIIIWRLQMSIGKRVAVCGLFAIRLLYVPSTISPCQYQKEIIMLSLPSILPVVAARLAQLQPSTNGTPPKFNTAATLLTEAELELIFVLASVTCLKPLFQPFHPGFFATANPNLAVTGYTNRPGANSSSREAYYELSGGASRAERERKQPLSHVRESRDDASDEVDLVQPHHRHNAGVAMRPDEGETWSEAIAAGGKPKSKIKAGPSGDSGGIEAMRSWTVSYEDR
ncbi:hypothetical protein LTR78_006611 [Recurvomyces mirabilis]|uniref:Rhodopsin domain-containing protein n=1 Tax=Recurvomyces mirabilis TaxID=574656 RepID=A0AAE0WKG6_9PEZI|nr:hypothetical protein LTR78_006611 [Recurvomyces mirabilis]